ncbi:MAG: hypothetical protein Q7R93_04235 [bacterium]|nr:hypothetical protein [bacterium]
MELTYNERLELNAALCALFEEDINTEEVQTIATLCQKLSSATRVTISLHSAGEDENITLSGHTSEAGQQAIETKGEESKPIQIGGKGCLRVGDFKVRRRHNTLIISRFWESDVETRAEEDPPLRFMMGWDFRTLVPAYAAKIGYRKRIFMDNWMGSVVVYRQHLSVLWGEKENDGRFVGNMLYVQPTNAGRYPLGMALGIFAYGIFSGVLHLITPLLKFLFP